MPDQDEIRHYDWGQDLTGIAKAGAQSPPTKPPPLASKAKASKAPTVRPLMSVSLNKPLPSGSAPPKGTMLEPK